MHSPDARTIIERKEVLEMKYVMCANCGRRLCKAETGAKVDIEIECPKCGEATLVTLKGDELLIRPKPQQDKLLRQHA